MTNPIFDNIYKRLGVTCKFADDFSTVEIFDGNNSIVLTGNAITDIHKVMSDNIYSDSEELALKRFYNIVSTTAALPESKI